MAASKPLAEQLITDNIDVWTSAIKKRGSQGRGSSKKIELYGIKKLRELILELAVRGLLVPQDPSDEPASVLLEKVAAEKEQLIKDGKIKKQKSLPEITEEEKPYALPEGWEWVRLNEICELENGDRSKNYPNKSLLVDKGLPFVNAGHLQDGRIDESQMTFITQERFDLLRAGKFSVGDILYCLRGSLGKSAIVDTISQGAIASSLVIVRLSSAINRVYMHNYFDSPLSYSQISLYDNGTAQPNLSASDLGKFLIPMSPEAEQPRIVSKVNELMALCDQLEQQTETSLTAHQTLVETLLNTLLTAAQTTPVNSGQESSSLTNSFDQAWNHIAQHFDVLFTTEHSIDQLKQTILQLAVMGKLVPQDPNDEPASVLLEKIAAEKEQLIKDKKIKKQKALPPIGEDEKSFDLPSGWEWVTLSDVHAIVTDGDHQAPPKADEGIPFLVIGNLNKGSVDFTNSKYVPEAYYESLDWARKPCSNDLLYTVTGSYGIPVKIESDEAFCVQRHVAILKGTKSTPREYLIYALSSKLAFDFATEVATGIAQKTVPLTGLRRMPVALPPKKEYLRIVAKVADLMGLCEILKSLINESQITQYHLADSMAEQALN